MKTNIAKFLTGLALAAGLSISTAAHASSNPGNATKMLAGATALELPAKAADLVAKAAPADVNNVTAAVVKAAVGLNPSAAVAIVSAVARATPESAPVAAVTAVTLQHQRIAFITKAAAAAAPSQAAKIVAALIREFPQDYGIIAIAAADGAPAAGREILAVVADYVPSLQSAIKGSTAGFAANNGNVPVQAILSESYNQALASGAAVRLQVSSSLTQNAGPVVGLNTAAISKGSAVSVGSAPIATTPGSAVPRLADPSMGAPYTTPPGMVNNIGPGQIMQQSAGGRNYAGP